MMGFSINQPPFNLDLVEAREWATPPRDATITEVGQTENEDRRISAMRNANAVSI